MWQDFLWTMYVYNNKLLMYVWCHNNYSNMAILEIHSMYALNVRETSMYVCTYIHATTMHTHTHTCFIHTMYAGLTGVFKDKACQRWKCGLLSWFKITNRQKLVSRELSRFSYVKFQHSNTGVMPQVSAYPAKGQCAEDANEVLYQGKSRGTCKA